MVMRRPFSAAPPTAAQEIRGVIENWAIWRDSGDWERFATVWHRDGYMSATWFQGSAEEFIAVSRKGFEAGVRILHFLGGTSVDVVDDRAVAQTKMTITQRSRVHGVLADVVCTGRFYDFFLHEEGQWQLVHRQPIYETDRLTPVDPGDRLTLDAARLAAFPVGYRYLAYLQTEAGHTVQNGLPGLVGPEVEELYRTGDAWLAGAAVPEYR
ncbi:nuclear transport factor 2 family protein [Streptomyces sp. NPDC088387]|uniref:nuclear transport factor 2 family protein n=1 Tax=Streptomyces sp. NPDC088387 TaxID=3365859 RepID=UPI003807488F